MLPEQVWDHADLPNEGMYCGRSAGSAQPLVWAHAEYLKLLRSIADGVVFDRISVVAARYAVPAEKRSFLSRMEVFRLTRPITNMLEGGTLRIVDAERFQVVWSADDWKTVERTDSRQVGYPGSYADIIPTSKAGENIGFTLCWPEENRWLGRDLQVSVSAAPPTPGTAANRPQS